MLQSAGSQSQHDLATEQQKQQGPCMEQRRPAGSSVSSITWILSSSCFCSRLNMQSSVWCPEIREGSCTPMLTAKGSIITDPQFWSSFGFRPFYYLSFDALKASLTSSPLLHLHGMNSFLPSMQTWLCISKFFLLHGCSMRLWLQSRKLQGCTGSVLSSMKIYQILFSFLKRGFWRHLNYSNLTNSF